MAEKIWSIDRLDVTREKNGQEHVVHGVYWKVTASDEGQTYTYRGHTHLPLDEDAAFTAHGSLDEETVLGWVKDELNKHLNNEGEPMHDPTYTEWVEAQCDHHLEQLINPPHVDLPLPWASPEGEQS